MSAFDEEKVEMSGSVEEMSEGTRTPEVSMSVASPPAVAVPDFLKNIVGDGKPALGDTLPNCPSTIWNEEGIDVDEWQAKYREEDLPVCPYEFHATPEANAAGEEFFIQNRDEIAKLLAKHGTIWFRGFDLTKDPEGFRSFWEALAFNPCLDPIHSSGLRKFLSKKDAVYEEVNKQSLSKHYIGLHQEATFCRTATAGAFVCFKPATVSGGEFFIADAERIFRDMDTDVLKELIDRKIRISVSNLDLDLLGILPTDTKEVAMEKVRVLVADNVAPKFDMDLDMIWGTDGNDMRLQAIEHVQSPVNRHPVTGRPLWFCNMHNHARFLRDRRPCTVPEVGMTDVYYGNLEILPGELLEKVKQACEKNIAHVPMQAGDVLLCDNYRVLHGRDVFEGDRLHAVTWFGDGSTDLASGTSAATGDVLNNFINKFVVGE
jgi:alpha-ketoglutarate-dependent taurine dioxygenase